ncbi:hypothetical protein ABID23_001258 [Bartonella silvatica]|uniref:Uncharacterized protein n=1 Tax=Bartonella silvatica TaxID=357760 RepID=A0ABV2HHY1_9HYPH
MLKQIKEPQSKKGHNREKQYFIPTLGIRHVNKNTEPYQDQIWEFPLDHRGCIQILFLYLTFQNIHNSHNKIRSYTKQHVIHLLQNANASTEAVKKRHSFNKNIAKNILCLCINIQAFFSAQRPRKMIHSKKTVMLKFAINIH